MGQLSTKESNNPNLIHPPNEADNNSPPVIEINSSNRDNNCSTSNRVIQAADIGSWQNQLVRQTRLMQKVANITYEEFLANVKELNSISSRYLDDNGKQLVFAVKKGSDSTILWKATVRIACVKVDASTKEIDSHRTINLKQFLVIFLQLKHQADALAHVDDIDCSKTKELLEGGSTSNEPPEECVICMERKPELILPCVHSYCLPCIEQWNVDHKTCPVCREFLSSTEDGWIVSEIPDTTEIATEIQKSLLSLTQ